MSIPKIIHQTWKTEKVPEKWLPFQKKIRKIYPDWQYILWTDSDNENFVKKEYPDLYDSYMGLSKNIMRADMIRYLILYKMGGLYIDLDYEVLRPYDFSNSTLVLPMNRSKESGDEHDEIGNCIFASTPNHPFLQDVIRDFKNNPPNTNNHLDVMDATGPKFLTRIFYSNRYPDAEVPKRLVFHPPSPKNKREYEKIRKNKISYGIHHCWGSWIEKISWNHIKMVLKKHTALSS